MRDPVMRRTDGLFFILWSGREEEPFCMERGVWGYSYISDRRRREYTGHGSGVLPIIRTDALSKYR